MGEVPDSRGTLTFDLATIKDQETDHSSPRLCKLVNAAFRTTLEAENQRLDADLPLGGRGGAP